MLVSLKEARRIERRIHEKGLRNGYSLVAQINVFSDVPVDRAILDESELLNQRVTTSIRLLSARYDIRREIQRTNEKSGINDLISDREKYLKLLCLWQEILQSGENLKTGNIIARTAEAKRTSLTNGKENYLSGRSDTVDFIPISESLYERAKEAVIDLQRLVDDHDDQLAALNATTKITIANEIMVLLEENKII